MRTMITCAALAVLSCTAAVAQRPEGPTREQSAAWQRDRFAKMDADHNGIVTKEEMKVQLAAFAGEAPPQRVLDYSFAIFDTDGDGKVTADEAAAAATSRFTDADTDHDGIMSAEEQQAFKRTIRW